MNTTPLPPLPTPKGKVWPPAAFDDDQMQAYATAARADLEAENQRLIDCLERLKPFVDGLAKAVLLEALESRA